MIALALDDWLRLQGRDGLDPPRSADVRRVMARVALAAPETASARCPRLLRFVGPEVAERVNALVSAGSGSRFDADGSDEPLSKVSAKVASDLIGITERAVRYAVAAGHLTATKHPVTGEWRIDRASAEAYRRQACP